MTGVTPAACRDCREGVAHCHGLLVVHAGDDAECLDDPDCVGEVDQHDHVRSCVTVVEVCACGA